jgi:uncharacterized protein (UPF0332 family)
LSEAPNAYLVKARRSLEEAQAVRDIGLFEAAGRAAYLAAFHAAQALILARTDKTAKTHSGVRSEFARLAKDDPGLDRGLAAFLAQAYNLKIAADYAVDLNRMPGVDDAAEAIEGAKRFVQAVESALRSHGSK